jgi:hypothetical protein
MSMYLTHLNKIPKNIVFFYRTILQKRCWKVNTRSKYLKKQNSPRSSRGWYAAHFYYFLHPKIFAPFDFFVLPLTIRLTQEKL